MKNRPLLALIAAASFCVVLPVQAQVVQPDSGQPGGFPLKPGAATALIQERCIACHDLRRVVNSNKDAEEWRETVHMMKAAGAAIDDAEVKQISDYLIANYLGLERPKATIVAGPANVKFKTWATPTPGSRPHDPLATPDGMIWWSGQFANRLGRLDPKTGEMKEFPIPVRGGPHGLINDKDGNIWYAGNWGGHIGRLDPKTGEWKQFAMPDPKVKDPHTPLFDKNGILWFSAQNSGVMGRLDPKTGDIKLFTPVGAAGQQPYALRFLSDGRQPWYSYFGSNKIATIDPDTFALKEFTLPDAKTRIRRMDVTSDDMIWFGDWSNGKLVRFNPRDGSTKEWPGPGGQLSQPYGLVVIDDVIWYCESNLRPNTLVRFDPKTEKFQTWEMPDGGGIVRHMMKTRDGNIAMALSGISKIGLVEILPSNSN
ncbi:MAG: virginiamycin lyase [Alphaproteobacteria bacterium]|nr:virginiamycin lyase [Alphaproteobacteria bacterium]